MPTKTRILIVDDHPIFRQGAKQVLATDSRLEVVGEADDGESALELIKSIVPDVLVLDLNLPKLGGLELLERIGRLKHPPVVVVLTMYRDDRMLYAAMDQGAHGYVLKESAAQDLIQAIHTVLRGEVFVTPVLAGALLRRGRRAAGLHEKKPGLARLTPSERRVLKLVSQNKTTPEIAGVLFISPRTVETHRARICEKLGLHGSHALLHFAIEHREAL